MIYIRFLHIIQNITSHRLSAKTKKLHMTMLSLTPTSYVLGFLQWILTFKFGVWNCHVLLAIWEHKQIMFFKRKPLWYYTSRRIGGFFLPTLAPLFYLQCLACEPCTYAFVPMSIYLVVMKIATLFTKWCTVFFPPFWYKWRLYKRKRACFLNDSYCIVKESKSLSTLLISQ